MLMESFSEKLEKKQFGQLKCFCFRKKVPLLCIGPHWPFSVFLLVVILLLSVYFILYACPYISNACTALGVIIWGGLLVSFLLTSLINPGIETKKSKDENLEAESIENYCEICEIYKKPKTEHCKDCGVCIKDYDHHCPWTSKCVGRGNIIYFFVFLMFILISFVFSIVVMALQPINSI